MINDKSPEFIKLQDAARKHALEDLKAQGMNVGLMSDMEKAAFEVGLASGVYSALVTVVGTML